MPDNDTPAPSPAGSERRRVLLTGAAIVIALVVGLWAGAAFGRTGGGTADMPTAVDEPLGTGGS